MMVYLAYFSCPKVSHVRIFFEKCVCFSLLDFHLFWDAIWLVWGSILESFWHPVVTKIQSNIHVQNWCLGLMLAVKQLPPPR